jgi:site-specific DNA-methyltransferase (adenine-specific)
MVHKTKTHSLALDYHNEHVGRSLIVHADCFEWLSRIPEKSLHAIVTDPPYGVKEFEDEQLAKRGKNGGIWRIPPSFDGHQRAPLPRFTALNNKERDTLRTFFREWSMLVAKSLRPGGHVFLASNTFMSQMVFQALVDGGLEFRGELIRLVRTLRGGDRPKNAEAEFEGVSSLPRGCYEPWGIFRCPMERNMKVSDCLRVWETGGLRRMADGKPFNDVILSERTPRRERTIAKHPSIKPQSLLRQLVYAALPLGKGVVADPFMGSGSTIAACEAVGVDGVGVERYADYYQMARVAISKLARLKPDQPSAVDVSNEEPPLLSLLG